MSHTYTQLLTHLVFSTKNRLPYLIPEVRPRLFAYMGGIVREMNATPIIINGVFDHAHLLVRYEPTLALSDLLRVLKTNSSRWAHETIPELKAFSWQVGYGAFSVSRSGLDVVHHYIANQETHHKDMSFKQEFLALLQRHEVEFDVRFLWE